MFSLMPVDVLICKCFEFSHKRGSFRWDAAKPSDAVLNVIADVELHKLCLLYIYIYVKVKKNVSEQTIHKTVSKSNYPNHHNLEHCSITRIKHNRRCMLEAKVTGTAGKSCRKFNTSTEMHFITSV